MIQWVFASLSIFLILIIGLMFFSPIQPVAWTAPDLAKSNLLCSEEHAGAVYEPEVFVKNLPGTADGLTMSTDGRLFAAVKSGHIVEVNPETGQWTTVANVPKARFLGISVSKDNMGLYAVDQATSSLYFFDISNRKYPAEAKLLTNTYDGKKLLWTNDVIAVKGGAYFTVTSAKRHYSKFRHELLEHKPNGMVLHYDDATGKTRKIFDRVYTANGINISVDGSSILVAETSAYQIKQVSDKGDYINRPLTNLPGLPGNLTAADRKGVYWLAMVAPRVPLLEQLAPYPSIRSLLAWLPEALQPQAKCFPCVIEMDLNSKQPKAHTVRFKGAEPFPTIATAFEYNGVLYLSPDASPRPGKGNYDGRLFRVKLK